MRENKLRSPDKFFLKHEDVLEFGALLDLACGDGPNALYFAERGYRVTAVDFSEIALTRLKGFALEKKLHVRCLEADLSSEMNFDSSFDLGFDSIILSHFKPEYSLLQKITRWLKPGGVLAICTFNTLEHLHNAFSIKYCLAPRELIQIDGFETIVYDSFSELSGGTHRYLDGYIFRKEL